MISSKSPTTSINQWTVVSSILLLWLLPVAAFQPMSFGTLHNRPTVSTPSLLTTPQHWSTPKSKILATTAPQPGTALTMTPLQGDVIRTVSGILLAAQIAHSGLTRKKSLRTSGAWAAFVVASTSLACSFRSGATLLLFYASSSQFTRMGAARKQSLEQEYQIGGQRGASQVLACSLMGVIAAVLRRTFVGPDGPLNFVATTTTCWGNRLTLAYVAFFACCAGDTWASEWGVLSPTPPRLVTQPWKSVAPGTNGGVSWVGLAASAAGGIAMGLVHGVALLPLTTTLSWTVRWQEIAALSWVGLWGGLGGSLLDSWLGATVQITHYDPVEQIILKRAQPGSTQLGLSILSNEMVNVVSTGATAVLAALCAKPLLAFWS